MDQLGEWAAGNPLRRWSTAGLGALICPFASLTGSSTGPVISMTAEACPLLFILEPFCYVAGAVLNQGKGWWSIADDQMGWMDD